MRAVERNAQELQAHMAGTYHQLRIGLGAIGVALPVVLWLGGRILDGERLRVSMSAYYYSPSMRNVFVGLLFAIGVGLHLYKGFSSRENRALDAAGLLAIGVALCPTAPPGEDAGGVTWHLAFAVLFFACIAYVALFRASDTLSLIRDPGRAGRLQRAYRLIGLAMVVSPLAAMGLARLLEDLAQERPVIFVLEALGVATFGTYWLLKSWELRQTDASRLALEGKLQRASDQPAVRERHPGVMVQLAPDRPEDESLLGQAR